MARAMGRGPSTDLFLFLLIQYNRGKDHTVPYQDKLSTDPPRAGHTSSVRLSRGGNRTTGKDPADLPRARGRALFI